MRWLLNKSVELWRYNKAQEKANKKNISKNGEMHVDFTGNMGHGCNNSIAIFYDFKCYKKVKNKIQTKKAREKKKLKQ